MPKFHGAIGSKLGFTVMNVGQFVIGVVLAFAQGGDGWKLTLACFGCLPLVAGSMGAFGMFVQDIELRWQKIYETAGRVANEVLILVRTVMAFGTVDREVARFDAVVAKARRGAPHPTPLP